MENRWRSVSFGEMNFSDLSFDGLIKIDDRGWEIEL